MTEPYTDFLTGETKELDGPFPPGMVAEIERFLTTEAQRPAGQDLYPEVFGTATFFPLQRQAELVRMMQLARSLNPRVVMEIGADKGGGLYHWCKCLPSVERVIACEIRGTPYADAFSKAFPHLDFLWLPQSSYATETVQRVRKWLGGDPYDGSDTIDCLFIDGDKSYFDLDFYTYRPLLSRKALVFFHDILDPEPYKGFEKARRVYEWMQIIDRRDAVAALEREGKGLSIANAHEGWLRHWKGASCGVGVLFHGGRP